MLRGWPCHSVIPQRSQRFSFRPSFSSRDSRWCLLVRRPTTRSRSIGIARGRAVIFPRFTASRQASDVNPNFARHTRIERPDSYATRIARQSYRRARSADLPGHRAALRERRWSSSRARAFWRFPAGSSPARKGRGPFPASGRSGASVPSLRFLPCEHTFAYRPDGIAGGRAAQHRRNRTLPLWGGLLGRQGSNPRFQNQNLACFHYTTPHGLGSNMWGNRDIEPRRLQPSRNRDRPGRCPSSAAHPSSPIRRSSRPGGAGRGRGPRSARRRGRRRPCRP